MNLNDYFDPVSLEKPEFSFLKADNTISRSISIHTPNNPISDISKYDVAIFGVREDRNAFLKGSATTPDKVREKLYLLAGGPKKVRVIDLGNLKSGESIEDVYFAIRDVFAELMSKSLTTIIIGGSQDLGVGLSRAYEEYPGFWNFTTLDSRLDFRPGEKRLHSGNYLNELFKLKNHKQLSIVNLGHQVYFTPLRILDEFENKGHASLRLGPLRKKLQMAEPVLRDTHIFSVDINAVRQSDAPAGSSPSPNGFFGHELCQLTRYAGASERMNAILFSEILPENDPQGHTSHLVAQSIWYFLEGYSIRKPEDPRTGNTKKFIVSTPAADQNMTFYQSNESDRWWMEIPVKDPYTNENYIISCGYEDYQLACTNEIPDRWWKLMRRFY